MNYSPFIKETLQAASVVAQSHFGTVTSSVKEGDNNQVLTEADLAIGKLIVERISKKYPEHNIIDEEAGVINNSSNLTWVVDPVDGTSNFAAGLPHFGVMLGLLEDDQPIAGGIVLPAFDEIYLGERGSGATCNGKPFTTSTETDTKNILLAYGIDGYQDDPERTRTEVKLLGEIILNIRNLRVSNSAFDMVMASCGKYGAYMNQTTKVWDNVAPQAIMEAAGGSYTNFKGEPIDYTDALEKPEKNYAVIAAAPVLHEQLVALVKEN